MNDISFGQYYPASSLIHKADARVKILLIFLLLVFIFVANSWAALGVMALLIVTIAFLSKVPLSLFIKNLKPVLPVLIVASLLNIFYVSDGKILFEWHFITISTDGLLRAAFILIRIVLLIIVGGLLTYTTTPTQLTSAIERLLSPLKYIGLGEAVHTMAMMMTIALRFIPTLIEEAQKIISAQKARGADFESGKLYKRIKAMVPILVPLLISSVRRALELANAMECRCYCGGKGRTHFKQFKMRISDFVYILIVCAVCTVIVFI